MLGDVMSVVEVFCDKYNYGGKKTNVGPREENPKQLGKKSNDIELRREEGYVGIRY